MTKFKVGDKVRIKSGWFSGMIGKIVYITSHHFGCPYTVLFDKNVYMLDRDGSRAKDIIREGYDDRKCWIYADDELELVEEEEMKNVKSLLKSGDIVVFGSGEKAKVFLDYESNYYGKGILAYLAYR